MIERHYSDLEPVKAIDQLRGEETRRLIDAGTVMDEAYQSNKKKKERVIVSHSPSCMH
jgi:2-keto-3-deoxy-6-phosphogluconate aldolase